MVNMRLRKGSNNEVLAPIPSYIRDELNLESKQEVDVKRVGRKIVITPKKE